MTSFSLQAGDAARSGTDTVVVGVLASSEGPRIAPGGETVAEVAGARLSVMQEQVGFTGKAGDVAVLPGIEGVDSSLLVLVGLGTAATTAAVRRAAGVAARAVYGRGTLALALPGESVELVQAVVEGYALGGYTFDRYRSAPERPRPDDVVLLTPRPADEEVRRGARTAEVVAAAVNRTRDWVNTAPGDLTPAGLADVIVAGSGREVIATVYDEAALEQRGCGGILGVGRGSDSPPRLVRLEYQPEGATTHLALVGKGITYDSGGLSIKPGASMATMKMDMAGAAAVANATFAIAELGLPVRVTAWAPMAENMISGSATRPGDVLTMYRGRTVEVLNTDAEGRLVLGDALGHAVESEPDLIVDVATLTGACVVALGDRVTGLFGNDEALIERVRAVAEQAGEALWPMPIPEEIADKVRSNTKIADLAQHNVDRWGGASYAAAFLREFVDEVPWVHLDIAGPAYNGKSAYGHVPTGGTGVSVATLVELARDLAADPFRSGR